MKLILYHFLHLYFLTLFEVIFYIYYVMPYEKELIYNLFDSAKIKNLLPDYNISNTNIQLNNKKCIGYQKKLDNYNAKLFTNSIRYIIIINILFLLILVYDIYQNYCTYCLIISSPKNLTPKYNSTSSLVAFKSSQNIQNDYKKNDDKKDDFVDLELINQTNKLNKGLFVPIEKSNIKPTVITDEYFIKYYYKNSKVVKEMCKLIQFIILVGIFEYLFFNLIVNKYKIANANTILCKIINEIIF